MPRFHRSTTRLGAVVAIVSTFCVLPLSSATGVSPTTPTGGGVVTVETVSNRADLVFDGDALVRITLPDDADPADLQVLVDGGRDVSGAFERRPNGHLEGLVTDLALGANRLTAVLPDGRGAHLTITNHPRGGPIISGPQLQPWQCQPGAVDAQCQAEPVITWQYKSTNPLLDGLQDYDPLAPPNDVATTTTDQGVSVPFIVRVETGYQNRDQYRIAVLWQPGQDWQRWEPQTQWNGKLFIPHGGSCGVDHVVGDAPTTDYSGTFDLGVPVVADAMGDSPTVALGRGFAMLSTALANTGHNCNVVPAAESLMMAKEHFVETYGDLRYTIGSGCSGGSIAQQTIANAYPGIYQGLVVTCSYPDSLSPGLQFADYHLLRTYFESTDRLTDGLFWNPGQWAAVEGHLLPVNAIAADELLFKQAITPTAECLGVSDEERYEPTTNPAGVRCSIIDAAVNVFGLRDPSRWSAAEQQIDRSFAATPIDNTGVQYGLEALEAGLITVEQFVDLNEQIGGLSIDAVQQPDRSVADAQALVNAYRSGMINTATNLSEVAIIDHRGPDPGVAHDARWSWVMRDRLMRAQGHAENQVIWYGAFPLIGDPGYSTQALLAMDRWLGAVESDDRAVPLSQKIVDDRPADLHDRCTQLEGTTSQHGLFLPLTSPLLQDLTGGLIDLLNPLLNPVLDPALNLVVDPVSQLACGLGPVSDLVQTRFGTPRTVAGDANFSDNSTCRLAPLDRDAYGVTFSDEQWATLDAVFTSGVCDYSQPPVGWTPTQTWMTYQAADGSVIHGGTPLPAAPASEPFGPGADDDPSGGTGVGGAGARPVAVDLSGTGQLSSAPALPETGQPWGLLYAVVLGAALVQLGLVLRLRSGELRPARR